MPPNSENLFSWPQGKTRPACHGSQMGPGTAEAVPTSGATALQGSSGPSSAAPTATRAAGPLQGTRVMAAGAHPAQREVGQAPEDAACPRAQEGIGGSRSPGVATVGSAEPHSPPHGACFQGAARMGALLRCVPCGQGAHRPRPWPTLCAVPVLPPGWEGVCAHVPCHTDGLGPCLLLSVSPSCWRTGAAGRPAR